jgi:beta-lactam-binding protein with PASTA domain/tRNA A-37 threonylcarbamoyl transferase component Bud32
VAPSRIDEQVGRVLGGRYRLMAVVGVGASGSVYRAYDVVLGRDVALKLLHPALASDEAFLRRFRAEARAAASLSHPHVTAVHDWGEDPAPYLVLEYLAGGSLRDLLAAGRRLSPSQAAAVGVETARALLYAHRRGLVHRDIKPANLLFDEEGRLRVADFGLARALAGAAWTEPSGVLLGTARYAAPEQVRGQAVDGRTDVYATALVLVEAVTGEVPFLADTTIATLMARVDRDLQVPEDLGPLVPVLAEAGRADRERRLDAAALLAGLERAAAELPPAERLVPVLLPTPLDAPDPTAIGPVPGPTTSAGSPGVGAPGGSGAQGSGAPPGAPAVGGAPPGAPAVGGASQGELGASRPGRRTRSRRAARRPGGRRRLRRIAGASGALALFAGLAGAGYGVYWLLIPTERVPALEAVALGRAEALVRGAHLRLEVVGRVYDAVVPKGMVARQTPAPHAALKEGSTVEVVVSKGPPPRPVPDLSGLDAHAAAARLAAAGFRERTTEVYSETVPAGQVLSWSPSKGSQAYGTTVTVEVSLGPRPRVVPDLAGDGYAEAASALEALGLVPARASVPSTAYPAGEVVGTVPAAGQSVPRGSTVTVQVSSGPPLVAVPDVAGDSVDQAVAVLGNAGLVAANVFGPPNHKVFVTDPLPGTEVPEGSSVNLYTR